MILLMDCLVYLAMKTVFGLVSLGNRRTMLDEQ
jgi:hypothetical protein